MGSLASIQQKRWLVLFIILIIVHAKAFSQLSAGFSAASVSGCAPIVVQFNDQSTGNPTQWEWDLGNGVVSYLQNPSATYFNPGTYHIKLIVRNGSGVDSVVKSNYITVYPTPSVDFSASDTSGCFPLPVQFTDLSTTEGGTLTNWSWDLGEGTMSTEANPTHIYDEAGNYSVTLKLTNSFGCTKTYTKPQYVKIGSGVIADFTNNNPGLCKPPVTLQFANHSTGPGTISYQWDFGDGLKSTEASPSHTYTTSGNYTVKLIATSSQGCVDTLIKDNLVAVGSVASSFTVPQTLCAGQSITISNTSTPAPGAVLWSFGDGSQSHDLSPVKTFNEPGSYTIKLVSNFGGCMDSVRRDIIVVANSKPAFSTPDTMGCKAPFTVSFINTTPGNNTYKWLFGDGSTSTEAQPRHTYTAMGNFTVSLIAINEHGCSDTLVGEDHIKIQKPALTVSGLMKAGCVPLTVTPSATVVSSEPVAGYLWNFGDGVTSTDASPSHTYNSSGKFDVSLIVTTESGCTDTVVIEEAVRTGEKLKAGFSVDPPLVCAKEPVTFVDSSVGEADEWLWKFGDGVTSTQQNPVHVYQDTGQFSVTLIVNYTTCPDTVIVDNAVYVKPPIGSFAVVNNCDDKFTKVFTDRSLGALTWHWSFGDGATSTDQNPTHTYASTGSYTVTLNVTNGACTNSATQIARVIDEKAAFGVDPNAACKGSPVGFKGRDFNPANIAKLEWDFGDGFSASGALNVSHTYSRTGVYISSLMITDLLGCSHIQTEEVSIYGPTANFFPSVAGTCLDNSMVSFADSSRTDGVNTIVKWVWNFGDGFSDSTSGMPYQHQYTKAGEYTISLRVVDGYGCMDNITKQRAVVIAQPRADFISPDSLSCTNKPIRFINRSAGYELKYEWAFGDGGSSVLPDPIFIYTSTGLYTVGLVVTDQYGCKDSVKKSKYVHISYPKASFSLSDSFSICPPLLVNFTNSSANYTSIKWDFADGNISTHGDPSHYYTSAGVFNARLIVTGPGGCVDSLTRRVELKGPTGTLDYPAQTGCNPHTATLKAHTKNTTSFVWDYSDGSTLATKDSVVSHTYTRIGSYVPKIILVDANGCKVAIPGKDTIKVVDVTAKFGQDIVKLCDSGYVRFRDSSVSNEVIKSWQWSFGDGSSSNEQHPVYHYKAPGSFTARLITTTVTGCKDTAVIDKKINVYESPVIDITGDLESCVPAQMVFKGKIVRGDAQFLAWDWDFGNGQTSAVQNPAKQTYAKDGVYQLTAVVTDDHDCKDSVVKVVNIYPLPVVDAGPDLLLCRDDSVQLKATGATSYGWSTNNPLSCFNCADPKASPHRTSVYQVTGYTEHGCTDKDSVKITVRQKFDIKASPNDSLCVGKNVQLSVSGADHYTWYPATGLDNPNISKPKARPQTSTLYTVVGRDNDNCFTDTATVFIKVHPYPTVDAGPDLTIPIGDYALIKPTYSADVVSWQWSPDYNIGCVVCDTVNVSPRRTTKYTVKVENSGGCVSADQMTVHLTCPWGNIFIPNTFSPNGDGNNDRFFPRGTGIALIRSLRVFNRWGELVFERMNFNANEEKLGWDGTYKGQLLSPDVYVYTCDVLCENHEVLSYTGDIALIR